MDTEAGVLYPLATNPEFGPLSLVLDYSSFKTVATISMCNRAFSQAVQTFLSNLQLTSRRFKLLFTGAPPSLLVTLARSNEAFDPLHGEWLVFQTPPQHLIPWIHPVIPLPPNRRPLFRLRVNSLIYCAQMGYSDALDAIFRISRDRGRRLPTFFESRPSGSGTLPFDSAPFDVMVRVALMGNHPSIIRVLGRWMCCREDEEEDQGNGEDAVGLFEKKNAFAKWWLKTIRQRGIGFDFRQTKIPSSSVPINWCTPYPFDETGEGEPFVTREDMVTLPAVLVRSHVAEECARGRMVEFVQTVLETVEGRLMGSGGISESEWSSVQDTSFVHDVLTMVKRTLSYRNTREEQQRTLAFAEAALTPWAESFIELRNRELVLNVVCEWISSHGFISSGLGGAILNHSATEEDHLVCEILLRLFAPVLKSEDFVTEKLSTSENLALIIHRNRDLLGEVEEESPLNPTVQRSVQELTARTRREDCGICAILLFGCLCCFPCFIFYASILCLHCCYKCCCPNLGRDEEAELTDFDPIRPLDAENDVVSIV